MITGLNQNQAIDRALAAGATDFITKPVQLTVLQERIERLLRGVPHWTAEDVDRTFGG